jgi:hypothetical protein
MKRILLALLVFTATAFAQSAFDGTWVFDVGSAQYSKKPHTYVLNKGMYACSTCVPKISVKADGQDQTVSGSAYFNTEAVRVVDANTVEIVDKKDGKTMYKSMMTVSADGKGLSNKFEDDAEQKPVTGELVLTRISKGPAGSHVISGSWQTEKMADYSSSGSSYMYQSTDGGMKMSDNNGQSYDAKFDGKDYPLQGDPGQTMVSLKKVEQTRWRKPTNGTAKWFPRAHQNFGRR